jgi:hypothetical protein
MCGGGGAAAGGGALSIGGGAAGEHVDDAAEDELEEEDGGALIGTSRATWGSCPPANSRDASHTGSCPAPGDWSSPDASDLTCCASGATASASPPPFGGISTLKKITKEKNPNREHAPDSNTQSSSKT